MMIHALRYEPQGQRQRFEPQEQQRGEQQEQDRHIHLHFHLNLTFRASKGRSAQPNAIRVTRIFAALIGATVMPLGIFIFVLLALVQVGPPLPTIVNLPWVSLFAGLALAWCAVGALLGRFVPSVLLLSILSFLVLCLLIGAIPTPLMSLVIPMFFVVLFGHPLITALLLVYVSRETRALRLLATAHTRLSFVVASGMVFMVLGGLLLNLNLSLMLGVGVPPVVFLPVMCGAVIVAICTLCVLSRERESTQAHPKDASPFDVDSPQEP